MNFRFALRSTVSAALLLGSAGAAYPWHAWTKSGIMKGTILGYYYGSAYNTIHSFNPGNIGTGEGLAPIAGLTAAGTGLLVGTTSAPGRAYALISTGPGTWAEAIIGQLGTGTSTPLTPISAFQIVGTEPNGTGTGDVFMLTNTGSSVVKSVIYTFSGGSGGQVPTSGILVANPGNANGPILYGTATGGNGGGGLVYALAQNKKGAWIETVVNPFTTGGAGGSGPSGELIWGKKQTVMYGTTTGGGAGNGVVYSLPRGGGENVLYAFGGGTDGATPGGLVTNDGKTFYGATSGGGNGQGTVYSITAFGGYKQLYAFANTADGHTPNPQLVLDTSSAIYGTSQGGGYGGGVAWVLTPGTLRKSLDNLTVLYEFGGVAGDGATPSGKLTIDSSGSLYGVTTAGGDYGAGAAYTIVP